MDEIVLRLTVDDVRYDVPLLNEGMRLKEQRIVKRYSGLTPDRYDEVNHFDPDVMAALIHIAIIRREPALTFAEAEEKADTVTGSDFAIALTKVLNEKLAELKAEQEKAEAEADAGPPEISPTGSGQPSDENASDSTKPSGNDSENGGDASPESKSPGSSGLLSLATGAASG